MKKIKLTQGQIALVDDELFEELNKFKWFAKKGYSTFYAARKIRISETRQTTIRMHRAIIDTPKGLEVDHIDGDGLNNCKSNLRIVTHRQNMQNLHIDRSSVFPGVCWHKTRGKWTAHIRINGICKHLGLFDIESDAHGAYLKALADIGEIFVNDIEVCY